MTAPSVEDLPEKLGLVSVSLGFTPSRGGWHIVVDSPNFVRKVLSVDECQDFATLYRQARGSRFNDNDESFLAELQRTAVRAQEFNQTEGGTIQ